MQVQVLWCIFDESGQRRPHSLAQTQLKIYISCCTALAWLGLAMQAILKKGFTKVVSLALIGLPTRGEFA